MCNIPSAKKQLEKLYDEICAELTNYENSTDEETTDKEWKDVFYHLLCRVTNEISSLQED